MASRAARRLLWASALGVFGWFAVYYVTATFYFAYSNYEVVASALASGDFSALPAWLVYLAWAFVAGLALIAASLALAAQAFKKAGLGALHALCPWGASLGLALFLVGVYAFAAGRPIGLPLAASGLLSLLAATAAAGFGLIKLGASADSALMKAAGVLLIAGIFLWVLAPAAWLLAFAGAARLRERI